MTIEPKPWGFKVLVSDDGAGNRVERLFVAPGGFCSLHHHKRQKHVFRLEWGSATIEGDESLRDNLFSWDMADIGDSFAVHPGQKHRFRAGPLGAVLRETITGYDPDDIVRHEQGGIGE